jgi:hypothetical protein
MHQRNCERVENHWLVSLAQLLKELPEVFALCDRLTVLRDGRHVRTMSVKETTEAEAVRLMVGRELLDYPAEHQLIRKYVSRLRVRTPSYQQRTRRRCSSKLDPPALDRPWLSSTCSDSQRSL